MSTTTHDHPDLIATPPHEHYWQPGGFHEAKHFSYQVLVCRCGQVRAVPQRQWHWTDARVQEGQ